MGSGSISRRAGDSARGTGVGSGSRLVAGRITAVEGLAAEIGLQAGDELLAVNGRPVRDVIDVQFYGAEPDLELLVRRSGELTLYEVEQDFTQALGLSFQELTFDGGVRRCNNRCLFCFVSQMAPPSSGSEIGRLLPVAQPPQFRSSLYVKDDDYRLSFLEGSYVTLTNLTEADWQRIEDQRLSPLYVSVHATDPALRRRLLNNPSAPPILDQIDRLARAGIDVHTQIVVVPGLNDGSALDQSVRELAEQWPAVQSVSVVPVGLTRFHRHDLSANGAAEAAAVLGQLGAWQAEFAVSLGDRFAYATDEWYLLSDTPLPPLAHYRQLYALQENGVGLVRGFLDDWEAVKNQLCRLGGRLRRRLDHGSITLVTGTLFASALEQVAAEFSHLTGIAAAVLPVVNELLGETITVAGLLMGGEVARALKAVKIGDLVALPEVMFRGPGEVTLDGVSRGELSAWLERPVVTADLMSELVDQLSHG